jgi:hypothetical protein
LIRREKLLERLEILASAPGPEEKSEDGDREGLRRRSCGAGGACCSTASASGTRGRRRW